MTSATPEQAPARSQWLVVLLPTVMAVTVFAGPSLGILSRFIIDDLGISRTQLGLVVSGGGLAGAVLGPYAGRYADRVGGKITLVVVFAATAAGLAAVASSPTYPFLIVAMAITGMAQSGSNPATNKLISLHFPAGKRGLVTGVKQSGVQIGIFVGGITLPATALAFNWRFAIATWSVIALIGLAGTLLVVPPDPTGEGADAGVSSTPARIGDVRWLTAGGLLNGAVVGSVLTYIPLYAQEAAGFSVSMAGGVASAFALAGLISRLTWSRYSEVSSHYSKPLSLVALLSTAGTALLWMAPTVGFWLLWVGAMVVGTAQAWNAIAMLAVISGVPHSSAGWASGMVAMGFGLGIASGPAAFGFLADSPGGYGASFGMLTAVGVLAFMVMITWGRKEASAGRA